MSTLALQRCLNHGEREAVARCVTCRHDYCRECIVEYEGRVLCAECRGKLVQEQGAETGFRRRLGIAAHLLLSIFVLWFCIYLFGKTLLLIPSSFHEGEVWKDLPTAE
jgi:hypothetical protein